MAVLIVVGSTGLLVGYALHEANYDFAQLERAFVRISVEVSRLSTPFSVLLMLSTFVTWFLAILLVVGIFHRRGFSSLIGRGPHFRYLLTTTLIVAALVVLALFTSFLTDKPKLNMPIEVWVGYMAIGVPLLLVQVLSEELLFRGYLMQELAARAKSRLIWWVLPSVIFGILHYQPAKFGENAWLVVAVTTMMGLILADITARCGSLVPAIIIHFANNFLAMMLFALDGTITGLALYLSNVHVNETDLVRAYLVQNLVMLVVLYSAWLLIQRRRARLQSAAAANKSAQNAEAEQP